ncbi:hypothetical protein, partial [Fischerella muscicola]|uniref:hypothetical protein n=1 Tax=Fischerella muscicola TaxID=92938 RepID=UPI001CA50079
PERLALPQVDCGCHPLRLILWEHVETRCLKRLGAGEWGSYLYQDFREMVLSRYASTHPFSS